MNLTIYIWNEISTALVLLKIRRVAFPLRFLFYPKPQDRQPFWQYLEDNNFDIYPERWNLLIMEARRAAIGSVKESKLVSHKNIRNIWSVKNRERLS